jgi:hypothetical protein
MHYVTHNFYRKQKHKFRVTCYVTLFIETAPGQPELEKYCVNISCPRRTGMHTVTCSSNRTQKYKFSVTCPGMLFMETASGPPENDK